MLFLLLGLVPHVIASESYHEKLDITHLPDNKVNTVFSFTSRADSVDNTHFDILPRPLINTIVKNDIEELHLTLTQGYWRDSIWGYSDYAASPGGMFYVWFGGSEADIEKRWMYIRNAISGITCSSLTALSGEDTLSPQFSLKPLGVTTKQGDSKFIRYAVNPSEVICTENLTPWLKLLPCKSRAGLSSLLDPSRIYDTSYHSLSLHVRRVCTDSSTESCQSPGWEIKQVLSLVFSPLQLNDRRDFSFKTLFKRTLVNACPVALSTKVNIYTIEPVSEIEITPKLYSTVSDREVTFDAKNITTTKILNVYLRYNNRRVVAASPEEGHVTGHMTGHTYISRTSSSNSGRLVTIFSNSYSTPLKLLYFQMIPWYLRAYVHTITMTTRDGDHVTPDHVTINLGKDRTKPYLLEIVLTVPANTNIRFSIQFDALLLRWNEYPPDAHHGRQIPSGIITFREPITEKVIRVFTESPLVYLPTPDFSMPFNVLCLVSTVIAIVYGSIFSLTTKKLVCIKESEVKQGLLIQLIKAVKGAVRTEKKVENKTTPETDITKANKTKTDSKIEQCR